MPTAKSSDVAKRFGEFAQQAQHETVEVTSYNRPYVAILSAREYERLRRLDRQAFLATEMPRDLVDAIEAAAPSTEARQYDEETIVDGD